MRLFLDSLTDQAVFTVDPDGVITTWSDGCQRLKGYSPEEAIGQHFRMLYTPEDRERGHPEHNLQRALDDGQFHEERVRLRKGGLPFMAEVSIYPLNEEDGPLAGFAKIVRDITRRTRLERERDTLDEKLRQAARALEGFCYSTAHDLHTPIRAMVSIGMIVLEDHGSVLPDDARKDLGRLVDNGKRLAKLVDDLLDFARLGQGELEREDVDVSAMANRVAEEIGPQCQGGTGRMNVQEGVRANVDPSMLELVLCNLIENSCKYSGPGVNIWFGMDVVDGQSVYYVRDDGIGFDMQYEAKLFEPFIRLHRQDDISGTGIGLANVRRIVDRHGGKVWAEAELNRGATFFFTLGQDEALKQPDQPAA